MRKGSLVVNNGWVGIYALSSLITNTQFKLGRRIVAALPHPPSTDGTIDNNWIPTASRYYIDTIIIFIMLPKFSPAVLSSVLLFSSSVIPSSAAAHDTDSSDGITSSTTEDKKQNFQHWYTPFQTIDKLTRRLDLTKKQKIR